MKQLFSLEPLMERLIFERRGLWLIIFLLATVFLGYQASFIRPDTDLSRMIPQDHEYVQNAKRILELDKGDKQENNGMLRIAVAVKDGDIFTPEYLKTLQGISDEVSLLPGSDTGALLSLWAPGLNWMAITEEGFVAGPVIDSSQYDGSLESINVIRENINKASAVGTYVANNFKSSMITVPVLAINPETQKLLDFQDYSHALEDIREKYQSDNISIHIIGDVKRFADLTDGFLSIAGFFAFAFVITGILLYYYSRGWKATLMPLLCSSVAVVWLLGMLNLLGYGIGVFSVLVPFLVFAIGISHGVQIINGIAHEAGKGANAFEASRMTFRHLVKPGMLALLSDGIGFATLLVINIGVIQDLAVAASIGVAMIILTNLVLLPLVMSYTGVTQSCIDHAQYKQSEKNRLFEFLATLTSRKAAAVSILIAMVGAAVGLYYSQGLKIGDLDKGAPELRADSRYNIDNNYITGNFSTSTDEILVFTSKALTDGPTFKKLDLMSRLEWRLQNTEGVQSVDSDASRSKYFRAAFNEGILKFLSVIRNPQTLAWYVSEGGSKPDTGTPYMRVELADHKEETLQRVVQVVEDFAAENNDEDVVFSLGYGNGVYEAATNQVIAKAQYQMLILVYGVVGFLALITFKSWRAVLCVMLPLCLTSILCQALMAQFGIGVKVGTLPVIALGVGIGVDYGIYIYSRLESYLHLGHPLKEAYLETLKSTGKAVGFTGFTLAVGVTTWVFSPIKFQADMGILLTFMFLWNMVGALWLLPALASFLVKPVKVDENTADAAG